MDDGRMATILVGAILLLIGLGLIPVGGGVGGWLILIGIIVLIVGLASSGSGSRPAGQQQQQQVVVMASRSSGTKAGGNGIKVECPSCKHHNAAAHRFCGQCGTALGKVVA